MIRVCWDCVITYNDDTHYKGIDPNNENASLKCPLCIAKATIKELETEAKWLRSSHLAMSDEVMDKIREILVQVKKNNNRKNKR